MPYLHTRIAGRESPETTKQVADVLTSLTATVLHKKPELTSVAVEYIDGSRWFVASGPISAQAVTTFYLEIHVTEGTNTKNEKAQYVKEAFASMQSILGKLHPASYIIIKDVRADSWGYEGATQEYRYIKGKML